MLDRYLLRELLVPLFYCLVGFQVFWLAFDLYSHLDEYRDAGLTASQIAQLCVMKMPELLSTVLPVALLLALLYALSNHARHNELVAMRAAGVSLLRLSTPYLAVGLAFGAVQFSVAEFLGPRAGARATALTSGNVGSRSDDGWRGPLTVEHEVGALRQSIENARFNMETGEMREFIVEIETADGGRQKISENSGNSRAEWVEDGWVFYDILRDVHNRGGDFPQQSRIEDSILVPELEITPEDLRRVAKAQGLRQQFADQKDKVGKHLIFTVAELRGFRDAQSGIGPNDPLYAQVQTQLHGRLAQPWMCVVVVLIALPFGAFLGRRSAFVGVAASVVLCLAYFILFRIGLALGTGGKLVPIAAAWLPNAVFAVTGIGLSWRLR
tara:strand:+ start:958 stop:2106 length:1149 start_codon:yes stop_codon:yes gene_type:complete